MDKNNRKRSPGFFLEQFGGYTAALRECCEIRKENENETKKDAVYTAFRSNDAVHDGSAGKVGGHQNKYQDRRLYSTGDI